MGVRLGRPVFTKMDEFLKKRKLYQHYMAEITSSTLGRKPTAGPDPAIMMNYLIVVMVVIMFMV